MTHTIMFVLQKRVEAAEEGLQGAAMDVRLHGVLRLRTNHFHSNGTTYHCISIRLALPETKKFIISLSVKKK